MDIYWEAFKHKCELLATSKFTITLFTTAKIWGQLGYQSVDAWIKNKPSFSSSEAASSSFDVMDMPGFIVTCYALIG